MIRRLALATAALALVAGCTAPTPSSAADVETPPSTSAAVLPDTVPAHLSIPAIGVDADLAPTGLNPDGTVRVPPLDRPAEVNYLAWSTAMGPRPIIVLSHVNGRSVDGRSIPGGFFRLHEVKPGDTATVTSQSGARAVFRVVSVRTVDKDQFPASIYDPPNRPTLVLITCGGQLNRAQHSYESNVIAVAEAVSS